MNILITGGTGSIGLPLTRLAAADPASDVTVLARGEYGHYLVKREMPQVKLVLGDVRHAGELLDLAGYDLVFNCAALKHVGFCEDNPALAEAINTLATDKLAWACSKLVQLSTDKAVNPSTVLGKTKLAADKIVLATNEQHRVVRLCNVVDSRGSLTETLRWQRESGRKVTVTDPLASRYYITADQAAALLWHAGTEGKGACTYVASGDCLTVGMVLALNGVDSTQWQLIGLQHSEKLHEDLLTEAEAPLAARHFLAAAQVEYYIVPRQ